MAKIDEIAADVFRISVYVDEFDLQFNHFLVRDDEPLLYHTGMRRMFPELHDAVSRLIDLSSLRWISWSHFEMDECGALNDWLRVAPAAQAACSLVGVLVNMNDFAARPARGLSAGDVLTTGKHRFRFCSTPHLPHGWDAGALFDETAGVLFCSDLFHQRGDVEAWTDSDDILQRTRETVEADQAGPLMGYLPMTTRTTRMLNELAALNPTTLAVMHGSSYRGNGASMLRGLAPVLEEVFG